MRCMIMSTSFVRYREPLQQQQDHHLKQEKYKIYEAQLRELLDYYGVEYDEDYFLK